MPSSNNHTNKNKSELEALQEEVKELKHQLFVEQQKNANSCEAHISRQILQAQEEIVFFALDHNYNYLSFNKAHAEIMNTFWNVEIEVGMNMLSVVSIKEEREKAKKLFTRALNGESFTIIENYSGCSEKPLYWELVHTPVRDYENKIIGMSVLLINRTESIANKNKVEKIQSELETELNTKNKFFSIVSHDLKNTLYGNVLLSKLLLENNLNTIEKTSYINKLYNSSNTTFSLLTNLLTWANSQQGLIKINKEPLNLHQIIQQAIDTNLALAEEKYLSIETKINKNDVVYADKHTLERVISNLFHNAIKFTPERGKIVFDSKIINDTSVINISDTGIGIDEKRIPQLFNITKNESTFGTNNEKGTGLG
ncbi:MAG: ATP-binding protein, partial [Vicingaceae bacterium]